ncbi:hypothetical protein NPIL_315511 [Nephila pilipes]|uniref:Uncharacterized protein n=1 Tax=Nephila pilipes TaxID=299642 RepID=A0A8X6PAM4_NEPPI|nr:hypothetical protein NPIL_315511 [Nephila pilipes]
MIGEKDVKFTEDLFITEHRAMRCLWQTPFFTVSSMKVRALHGHSVQSKDVTTIITDSGQTYQMKQARVSSGDHSGKGEG